MRTTITLDDDVFEAVRGQAEASGKRLGEVISELVRRGLRNSASPKRKNGLPVFNVPPDAEIIPTARARELLAEDTL